MFTPALPPRTGRVLPQTNPPFLVAEYVAKDGSNGFLDCDRFGAMKNKGEWHNISQGVHQVMNSLGGWERR